VSAGGRELAATIWQARRRRDALLDVGAPLFGEPAWDILLQLHAAGDAQPLTVTQACYGTNAALSTGLRYLSLLSARGLLVREPSKADRRSSLVRLSASGERMTERLVGTFVQE
jgi:DNA-binding MarR family transcriptional regulator